MTTSTRLRGANTAAMLLGATLFGGEAAADQVIPTDLIVQGSECVGFDCVNNENFGFDTIKLKENNLRILFEDTSVVAGFPTNDWRLIANDSASGGSNFFAIEDATAGRQLFKVSAGARANSVFVDSVGRVGFGTATPVIPTHVRWGDTPGLRLEQDGSSGFSPQTWDVSGNEANFFIRDVTSGSRLPFRIRPGAPTSSIDITATGNVGVGTANPVSGNGSVLRILQVHAPDNNAAFVISTADNNLAGAGGILEVMGTGRSGNTRMGQMGFHYVASTGLATDFQVFTHDGTSFSERVRVSGSGNVGIGTSVPSAQLHTTGTVRFAGIPNCAAGIVTNANGDLSCMASSRQFKHVAGGLSPEVALANVMALRPRVGAYAATPDEPEHWLIAEEAATVDAALVGRKDGKPYTVKTQNVVADLVAVIQQQQRRIEALERASAR